MMSFNKFIVPIVIIALAALILLQNGNPQWGKWFYIYQNYSWSDDVSLYSEQPPKEYTGVFRVWRKDGTLHSETTMKDGWPNGLKYDYRDDGIRYVSIGLDDPDWRRWTARYHYKDVESHELVKITMKKLSKPGVEEVIYDPVKKIDKREEYGLPQ